MLKKVKDALRIKHELLDDALEDDINTARAELIRSGCDSEIAMGDSDLVQSAIKTYCLYVNSDGKKAEGYWKSWLYQLENLRKSTF